MKIITPDFNVAIGYQTPEELARQAAARIISVSQTAPDPIRQQAEAFSIQVEKIVLEYVRRAVAQERRMMEK